MGTSGGEPRTLLNALKPMLGPSGAIKSPEDVMRLVSLMCDAENLMTRCVYLNILKSTISISQDQSQDNLKSTQTLERFVSFGGWSVLNKWLSDGKKTDNFSLIIELLEILKDLPVSVDTLKQGNTGKIVKYLTKVDNQDVKKMSSSILKQWMSVIRHNSDGQQKFPEKVEKSKQNGDSLETASQASDSSIEAISFIRTDETKASKRQREVDGASGLPEKKSKLNDVKNKMKKETKVIAIESSGFMNALATASAPAPIKKRKRPTSSAQKTTTSVTTTTTTSSTMQNKSGYSGLLDEIMNNQSQTHGFEDREKPKVKAVEEISNSANDKTSPAGSPQNGSPAAAVDALDLTKESESADKTTESNSSTPSTVAIEDVVDLEPYVKKPNKKGRTVTWPDDSKLASYHYFEMDEDERATIRHPINFINAAHNEMMNERMLIEKAKRLNEDKMLEKVKWHRPKEIEGLNNNVEYGSKSEEKKIQKERESSVLADIFFSKSSVPDSPAEPDIDHEKQVTGEPKVIPHDEKGTTHPTPKQVTATPATTASVQLPAALASLFSGSAVPAPPTTTSADPVSVQSLLDKIMSGTGSGKPLGQLLSTVKQQQQMQQQLDGGPQLPNALKNILEPIQGKPDGPRPLPQGLLGVGPGDMTGSLNSMMPPGQFGPRGPRGPPFRPEQRPRFPGPGGPRPNQPFPGPDGPIRGSMPPGMRGPRPLIPELTGREEFGDDMYDKPEGIEDDVIGPNMRGRGRGVSRGRGRGRARGRGLAPVCRHFVSPRGCLRGESCHFLHPGINGPPI